MYCLLCGKKIALLRKLKDPDFCSEAHRDSYLRQQESLAISRLMESKGGKVASAEPPPIIPPAPGAQDRAGPSAKKATAKSKKDKKQAEEQVPRIDHCFPIMTSLGLVGALHHRAPSALPVRSRSRVASPQRETRLKLTMPMGRPVPIVQPKVAAGPTRRITPDTTPEAAEALVRLGSNYATTEWLPPEPAAECQPDVISPPEQARPEGPPAAEPVPWSESWRATWLGRAGTPPMRRLWAQPVPPAQGLAQRKPILQASIDLSLDGAPLQAAVASGSNLRGLRAPRLRPPQLARFVRPRNSDTNPLTCARLAMLPPASMIAPAGFSRQGKSTRGLVRAAYGGKRRLDMAALPLRLRPVTVGPLIVFGRGGRVPLSGKLRNPVFATPGQDYRVWIAPVGMDLGRGSVAFGELGLPSIRFDPPLSPLLTLRMYPNSAGGARSWKRAELPGALPSPSPNPVRPGSGLKTISDWLPVWVGFLPIPFRSPVSEGRPLAAGQGVVPVAPLNQRQRRLAVHSKPVPIREVTVQANKMRPYGWARKSQKLPGWPMTQLPGEIALEGSFKPPKPVSLAEPEWKPKPVVTPRARKVRWTGWWRPIPRRARLAAAAVLLVGAIGVTLWPSSGGPGRIRQGAVKVTARNAPRKKSATKAGFLDSVSQRVIGRAAVALTDDFSHGLADWEGRGDWAATWGYDTAGFVRTGSLALFSPAKAMVDYRMEFVGQIERRGLGWAVRAPDLSHYYALRLVLAEADTRPRLTLIRYPVIRGVAGRATQRHVEAPLQGDAVYRVVTEVNGDAYTVSIQGRVADSWTESRLERGGVGFFSFKGEQARIRWVGVWHQYDYIGRLCAFLAAHGLQGRDREE
jgi:hypothetical protein